MTVGEALAALARRELALVLDGAVEELDALHAQREALTARLQPGDPGLPAAVEAQALVTAALKQRRAEVLRELRELAPSRQVAQAYAASASV
jgi:hypothetical protein